MTRAGREIVVDVAVSVLADMRHERPGRIVLPELPPSARKGVERIGRDYCLLEIIALASRQAAPGKKSLDHNAALQIAIAVACAAGYSAPFGISRNVSMSRDRYRIT